MYDIVLLLTVLLQVLDGTVGFSEQVPWLWLRDTMSCAAAQVHG